MRLIPILLILFLFDLYVFQAFRAIAQPWSGTVRAVVFGIYWAIPLAAAGLLISLSYTDISSFNKHFYTFLRTFIFIAYFSKLVIAVVLVADDLRRLALTAYSGLGGEGSFDPSRSRFMSQLGILLGSIPFLSLTYGILRNPYRYKVFRETIRLDDLPDALDGLRIVHISDIHSGSFTMKEPVKSAIDLINRQKPDLVLFTGDLVNYMAKEMKPFLDVFSKIQARFGVFSVLGNHDYGDYVRWPNAESKRENMDDMIATHRELGWQLLLNENHLVDVNGEKVAVIGVENYSAHPRFPKYGDLEKAYQGAEQASLKLLLSHDPSHWEDQVLSRFQNIAVTFSGHTHGMQFGVEIPGWIKWSPIQYVYKQWAGLYRKGSQFLYVNRGLGFLGYPGRVGILPEVAVIELKSGKSS
jgi:uncharacterized protein